MVGWYVGSNTFKRKENDPMDVLYVYVCMYCSMFDASLYIQMTSIKTHGVRA